MKKYFLVIILMLGSGLMLFLGFSYTSLEANVSKIVYSDKSEYIDINKGMGYINSLPMNINVINKYFSNINNLDNKLKFQIFLAYLYKNNYLYDCGSSTSTNVLCLNKSSLEDRALQNKIGINNISFKDSIEVYLDNIGSTIFNTSNSLSYYKISVYKNKFENSSYSEFYKYKKINDLYVFYVYQGFIPANCTLGSDISLYDYITGKKVYTGKCNGAHSFTAEIKDYSKLQLYKYELKKDSNDNFYLSGYNPVNSVS